MYTFTYELPRVLCKLGDHDRISVGHLWAFCGLNVVDCIFRNHSVTTLMFMGGGTNIIYPICCNYNNFCSMILLLLDVYFG